MRTTEGRYHSALKGNRHMLVDAEPCNEFRCKHGTAVAMDFMEAPYLSIIRDFNVDVIYADVPFPHGMPMFNAAAGIECSWGLLMARFQEMVDAVDIPVFALSHAKALSGVEKSKIVLNGVSVNIDVANIELQSLPATAVELRQILAENCSCVWDPFCGYGNTGLVFARSGKRFFLSDYGAKAIGAFRQLYEEEFCE